MKRIIDLSLMGAVSVALLSVWGAASAHANVYATNIKLNGGSTNVSAALGEAVAISYILNEPASGGVTVNLIAGAKVIPAVNVAGGQLGTLRGTNIVTWAGRDTSGALVAPGVYSVSITAASIGYTNWTQITDDTNTGNYVWEGRGIAVDRNPASPFYGRIWVDNSHEGPDPVNNDGDQVGVLKLNADGSFADEGRFTTGGYTWAGDYYSPWRVEVSDDDFVYINDWTSSGEILRWDPTLASNSLVHVLRPDNWDTGVNMSGPAIFGTGTNTTIWMADINWPGSRGIIKYSVRADGTIAHTDVGTTVVGTGSDLSLYPYDVALDKAGNIYTVQPRDNAGDPAPRVLRFPAYDPSTNGGAPELTADWKVGEGDDTYGGAVAVAVDPTGTYLAVAFRGYVPESGGRTNGNTRVLYTTNGAVAAELDLGVVIGGVTNHQDTDCTWDAVGNVYYIDNFVSVWRSFSPPGSNQATTVAIPTLELRPGGGGSGTQIVGVTISNGIVTITFAAAAGDSGPFTILSSPELAGPFTPVTGVTITGGGGLFQAQFPANGEVQFYRIQSAGVVQLPHVDKIAVAGGTVTLDFTSAAGDSASAFTVLSAPSVEGPYTPATGATVTGGGGLFQATVPVNGPTQFYRIQK